MLNFGITGPSLDCWMCDSVYSQLNETVNYHSYIGHAQSFLNIMSAALKHTRQMTKFQKLSKTTLAI